MVGSRPYPKILNQPGKARQGQVLRLIFQEPHSDEEKKFYLTDTSCQCYKTFFSFALKKRLNKLEHFSSASISIWV
jgi:hypothetical protein